MSENLIYLIFTLFIVGIFVFIWLMDRQIRLKGALFTNPASRPLRILAFLIGIFFAGWSWMEISSGGMENWLFPVIAVALIAYSFGSSRLLNLIQDQPRNETEAPMPPRQGTSRFLVHWLIRLLLIAAVGIALYGAASLPDARLLIVLVTILVLLLAVSTLRDWYSSLKKLVARIRHFDKS